MSALRDQRWWGIAGVSIAVLGNVLAATLWIWALFSTPTGTHARYIIEAGISFIIAAATLVLALPFIIAGASRHGSRATAVTTLLLALTPFPLGVVLMRLLAMWRGITLSP